ncbi:MAG: UDP-N-acetylglucosamine 2-epimerase (non-hydrolyzing) [Bacteroidetes bacterium]|nr:UDP-N-acetylglucosamine 2-epimerase (non-hydrolyzing) [Bacteroidota bacterium]
MLHILTVIGARPQIIKAAALSRAIHLHFTGSIKETIVHTGQHYDENMSQVFFDELGIPSPNYNLNINLGNREEQIAFMVSALEKILMEEKPDAIVLYGDTNSTKAGAEAGKKMNIPIVHIEAGLRSFNLNMPEELNRIYADQVSSLLFSPTATGIENLKKENISKGVYHCGDVMYDNSLFFAEIAEQKSDFFQREKLEKNKYFLATVHRDFNADSAERLISIFAAFDKIAIENKIPIIIPIHPRTRKQIELIPELKKKVSENNLIRIIPPASFLEMILLEKNAKLILTDSGGVQKEAYFFKKPCVILRPETEWVELVEIGAAILADADSGKIEQAVRTLLQREIQFPDIFGDGHAAEFICSKMNNDLSKK